MRRSKRDSRSHESSGRRGHSVRLWASCALLSVACSGTEVLDQPNDPPVWPIRAAGSQAEAPPPEAPTPEAAPEPNAEPEPAVPAEGPDTNEDASADPSEQDESTGAADDATPPTEEDP